MSLRFVLTFPLLLASAALLPAEAPPASSAEVAQEHATVAEKFCNERLAVWQKRLKLEDWNLKVRLVHTPELKPKTLGNLHWDHPAKTALIRVLAMADYKLPYAAALQDMEFTVVHELVHLQLSDLPRSDASRGAEERAVNRITDSLLSLAKDLK